MEGKSVLFKRFADIDVFDLELDTHDPEAVVQMVKLLEPTFGGSTWRTSRPRTVSTSRRSS